MDNLFLFVGGPFDGRRFYMAVRDDRPWLSVVNVPYPNNNKVPEVYFAQQLSSRLWIYRHSEIDSSIALQLLVSSYPTDSEDDRNLPKKLIQVAEETVPDE